MGSSSSHSRGSAMPSSSEIRNKIEQTISENDIVIYGKRLCPYCIMARKVFQDLNVEFMEIDVNKEANTEALQAVLHEMTGARTVPRVFVGGKCIGGGSDTKALYNNGELQQMIDQCRRS